MVMHGCDVSREMLAEAERERENGSNMPTFAWIEGDTLPYQTNMFDVIATSAVFHHIPPASRASVFQELARVLKPGGRLYLFEHNPYHPITQWVVRHTAIDRNAILLTPREVSRALTTVSLSSLRLAYFLFFPPRFTRLRAFEKYLGKIPLGGQYVIVGEKHCGGIS